MKVRFKDSTKAFHEDENGELTHEDFLRDEWITMDIKPTREELLSFESPFDWQFWEDNTLHALDRVFHAAGVDFQVWNPDRYEFQVLDGSLTADAQEVALRKIAVAQDLEELIREFDSQGIAPLEGDVWDSRSMREFLCHIKEANFFEDETDRNLVRKIDKLLAN